MKKRSKKQKNQQTKQQKLNKNTKGNKRKLPSLRETEAYIKEHNLRIMDPLSDYGFKRLLASERNKDILMHLLNVFISDDTGIITDISYLPTEVLGIRKEDRFVRYDLYCTNQDGKRNKKLSKFAAQLETLDMSDERNRILYMVTNVVYLQQDEINTLTPMQMRFYEECQINNFTDMEKQDYVKSLMDYPSVQEMVECERAEAKEEGIQIGIQMGLEQGREQGLEQGLEQGREEEKRLLVLNMLAEGLDPSVVAKIARLTEEEVRTITG